jgi:hypothetical protein
MRVFRQRSGGRGNDFCLFSPKTTQNPKNCPLFQKIIRCTNRAICAEMALNRKNDVNVMKPGQRSENHEDSTITLNLKSYE